MDLRPSRDALAVLAFSLGLFAPTAYSAGGSDPDLSGVWTGTLGKQKITVCFNRLSSRFTNTGSYYYQRHLQPIRLVQSGDESIWNEEHGRWTLSPPDGEQLPGLWSRPDGTGSLPIALARVPKRTTTGYSQANDCGGDAYNRAIESPPKVEANPEQRSGDIRYRVLRISVVTTEGADPLVFETIEVLGAAGELGSGIPSSSLERRHGLSHAAGSEWDVLERSRHSLH